MIENEKQLAYSYEQLGKMYKMRERDAVEPLWHPDLRQDMVESTSAMIRKIEREVAAYLIARYGNSESNGNSVENGHAEANGNAPEVEPGIASKL